MNNMILNMGPQHPSMHGVLRLELELDGETVINCKPHIGYLHRGLEKMAESKSYIQYLPLVDRVDYLSGFFYSFAFCDAVEKLNEIEVCDLASNIRILMMELNRISSHLLWLGTYLLDLGAISPFFYTFREREKILEYFEQITGQRMMYNYFTFGGVRHYDLKLSILEPIINDLKNKIDEYEDIISENPIFISRTSNIGTISQTTALDYSLTGVNLRASGVLQDYRLEMESYDPFEFDIVLSSQNDCYGRYIVRLYEMRESISIIEQCLDLIKGANIKTQNPNLPNITTVKTGETVAFVESPRGLMACYLNSVGESTPYRVKWRTGSFYSVQILGKILKNVDLSDVISIYGSLDVVLPEVDR